MHGKLLLLLLLMLSVPALSARAQAATVIPQVGLGYSPGTLTPIDQGTPVYTAGDELWVVSYGEPLNVVLLNSSGRLEGTFVLGHMQPTLLHAFTSSDRPGRWLFNITTFSSGSGNFYFSVGLVDPSTILPQMTSVHVDSSGLLSLGFNANLGTAYATKACLVGQTSLNSVPILIPASLGTGQLILTRNGSLTTIQPSGRILAPFTFWFELHAGRSYEVPGALVTRDSEEAATAPLPFSSGPPVSSTVGLVSSIAVREGRATVRAFFESSVGLQTSETTVLILDTPTWASLPGCSSSMDGVGSNFTASVSLRLAPNLWPRSMYLMYAESGVEAFSRVPISVFPSVVNLVASPWGAPLTDSGLTLAPPSGAIASVGNSTVYIISSNYPVEATLLIPGPSATLPLLISQPFTVSSVELPTGKILVQSLLSGGALSNSSVFLRLGNQTIATGKGSPTFYVPPGSYTLFAAYRGTNRNQSVAVVSNSQNSVAFEFGNPTSQVDYLLMVTAVIGALASGVLWASLVRDWRKKSKFRQEESNSRR
ncbi:MAG TPA: hypothetical protein VGR56_03615 [Nitrososphaerales archaeon]|nr:hypothetical protein [Nitrososphaerales archaeon]